MLGKKSRNQAPIGTLVGAETRVHGDIEFAGGCHIDGYVKGNVRAGGPGRRSQRQRAWVRRGVGRRAARAAERHGKRRRAGDRARRAWA